MSLPCGFMASGVDVNGWVLVSRLYFPGERLNLLGIEMVTSLAQLIL